MASGKNDVVTNIIKRSTETKTNNIDVFERILISLKGLSFIPIKYNDIQALHI